MYTFRRVSNLRGIRFETDPVKAYKNSQLKLFVYVQFEVLSKQKQKKENKWINT